jgi:hypothetical protein
LVKLKQVEAKMTDLPEISGRGKDAITKIGGVTAAGAAIGSIIPGVGTVLGAGLGAIIGGAITVIGVIADDDME